MTTVSNAEAQRAEQNVGRPVERALRTSQPDGEMPLVEEPGDLGMKEVQIA